MKEAQPKVLSLFLYLVRNRDRVVSKEELLDAVWSDAAVRVDVANAQGHDLTHA